MKAKTGSRTCEVEMISKDGNRVEITVDGKLYDIDVVMSENGFCSILHGGRYIQCRIGTSLRRKIYHHHKFSLF